MKSSARILNEHTSERVDAAGEFRRVMGQFATGVTIMTTIAADGTPHGMTVNSFSSLSLDPPLVLWSIRQTSASYPVFKTAQHFAINILSSAQEETSRIFSKPVDRFAEVKWEEGIERLPLIKGSLAWVQCEMHSGMPGGDHTIFIGKVIRAQTFNKTPLLYWRGTYFPTLE